MNYHMKTTDIEDMNSFLEHFEESDSIDTWRIWTVDFQGKFCLFIAVDKRKEWATVHDANSAFIQFDTDLERSAFMSKVVTAFINAKLTFIIDQKGGNDFLAFWHKVREQKNA